MITENPITCDAVGCGKQRTETNHWWAVEAEPDRVVRIWPWSAAVAAGRVAACKHFCGQDHALRYVSSVLTAPYVAPSAGPEEV